MKLIHKPVKNQLVLFSAFIFLISCSSHVEKENGSGDFVEENRQEKVIKEINDDCKAEFNFKDKKGQFVKLERVNDEYVLKWGNKNFEKLFPEKFECYVFEDTCDFTPKLKFIKNDLAVLECTTFTPSAGNCSRLTSKLIVLPFDENRKEYEQDFFIKIIDDYIISSNEHDTLIVTNSKNKKQQLIPLDPQPIIVFKTLEYSIEKFFLEKSMLYFSYVSGSYENETNVDKKIKIDI